MLGNVQMSGKIDKFFVRWNLDLLKSSFSACFHIKHQTLIDFEYLIAKLISKLRFLEERNLKNIWAYFSLGA